MNWIKISEVKPKVNRWILLANSNDNWVDRGELESDGTYSNGECEVIPTHWKPLSSAPKP